LGDLKTHFITNRLENLQIFVAVKTLQKEHQSSISVYFAFSNPMACFCTRVLLGKMHTLLMAIHQSISLSILLSTQQLKLILKILELSA